MANWRKTKTPDVYVAHLLRCPAFDTDDGRCRCEPSWRGRRHNRVSGKAEWQKPVTKDRSEVLSWLGIGKRGASHAREQSEVSRTFESIGDEWLDGVKDGRISRRKGRSKPYSPTTLRDYTIAYRNVPARRSRARAPPRRPPRPRARHGLRARRARRARRRQPFVIATSAPLRFPGRQPIRRRGQRDPSSRDA